jgi:hypothetical protein
LLPEAGVACVGGEPTVGDELLQAVSKPSTILREATAQPDSATQHPQLPL